MRPRQLPCLLPLLLIGLIPARHAAADSPYNTKNVIIASVTPSVDEEGIPRETFSLKYSAVKWTYDELNIDGNKSGKVNIQGAWNLANNTPNLS